jgi:hypothetical protein
MYIYRALISFGRVTSPSEKLPFLEDQVVSLSLASLSRPVRLRRPYQEYKFPPTSFKMVDPVLFVLESQIETKLDQSS